jgi:GNAT superfamily N-acetyltransferase
VKIDRAFCDALERAAVTATEAKARHVQTRFPELRGATQDIGGGVAVFAGVGSPLSEAIGIGLWERAGRDEAEELTAFYCDRGAQPRVCVSPYADPDFVGALVELGYAPLEHENALTADLPAIGGLRDERVTGMRDALEWSQAKGRAYAGAASVDEAEARIGLILCTLPESTALEIRISGAIAALGCMEVQGEIAGFYGSATAPSFRGRGLQSALIADRVARAVERGARFGRVTTRPGTTSEQNFRRSGFVPLYTRTTWGMPCSDSVSAL